MKTILLVFGTRPEAIKMCPLVNKLKWHNDIFHTLVCVSAQHREMLDQVLYVFGVTPDYDLNIMKQGQDLYDITTKVLLGMRDVLKDAQPDIVLVHGDTTTSTAACLAAFYQHIPVGHVEAGLRTFNLFSPWPEEANRQITSRLATYNFSPTSLSASNLKKENVNGKIIVTGNTVIDALLTIVEKLKNDELLYATQKKKVLSLGYDIDRINDNRKMVLITGHRRENFGEGFINICRAIKTLGEKYPNVDFVYPMHLNPNVRNPIHIIFGDNLINFENLFFINPLEYLSFVLLLEKSYFVLTDSGGIQEEAPALGKPVLVMRNTTERPEAIEAGTAKLVGTDYKSIVDNVSLLLDNSNIHNQMSYATNPYGDGRSCDRIVEFLMEL